ncbi:MAG: divergent polysaccharide deacetylase family protein [SAR86 cluster bacterium]|jgi:uncharacterized protein
MYRLVRLIFLYMTLISDSAAASEQPYNPAYIAIIIDDMGNHWGRGQRAIQLPAMLTYSILPYTQYGHQLAELAYQDGKEVMLHMPMANLGRKPMGPGGLTQNLTKAEFYQTLALAIEQIPHLKGINNHMGSQLTQQPQQMNWLMSQIKQQQLYFIDSRTTANTVASTVAKEQQIQSSSRDVFLDNDPTFISIDRAFQVLLAKARRDGTGIAIGHPHQATLDYLARVIPGLAAQSIEVISVSALIQRRRAHALQAAVSVHSHGASPIE